MLNEERTKRTKLLLTAAWAFCSLLLLLPATQSLMLLILELLKGASIRQPDLWKGRIRGIAGISLAACAFTAALLLSGRTRRKAVLYWTCILLILASFLLFPLKSRIAFQRFFLGLSLEDATDSFRTKLLLYRVLSFSLLCSIAAFLIKSVTFPTNFARNTQIHTAGFSILLILSFVSFNMGIPKHATGYMNNFWMFYACFDYGDYIETILMPDNNYSYPPMANILTGALKFPIHKIRESVASWGPGYTVFSPVGTYMLLLFFLTHLLPFIFLCHKAIQGRNLTKGLFSLAICTSSFVVYSVMRGNIILLAVSFTLCYMLLYDSKDSRLRQIALLSLAMATNIKIYPAIFGCLLLKEKRWKDACLCALYALLMLIIPFFTYDAGFSHSFGRFMGHLGFAGSDKISAPQDITPPSAVQASPADLGIPDENTMPTGTGSMSPPKEGNTLLKALTAPTFGIFSLSTAVAAFTNALHAPRHVYSVLRAICYLLYAGLSVLLFLKAKRRWCILLIPATACYLLPGMTYIYVPIFLLLPLIALLNTEHKRPAEYVAMLIFLLLFACNWTSWPCVMGYRHFPSILFSIGLYAAAFITELTAQQQAAPQH
ncbi:MAG: DUF2029 domain-containing protein [Treponema sp.]|nr:DUF2029 domain-containing protein [Treponema sp.]